MAMNMRANALLAIGSALALTACATTSDASGTASAKAANPAAENPFPSTYTPYPGTPTALVGATVYDGKGGTIEDGAVLFRDGKIVGVAAELSTEGYTVVDGTGKYRHPGHHRYSQPSGRLPYSQRRCAFGR